MASAASRSPSRLSPPRSPPSAGAAWFQDPESIRLSAQRDSKNGLPLARSSGTLSNLFAQRTRSSMEFSGPPSPTAINDFGSSALKSRSRRSLDPKPVAAQQDIPKLPQSDFLIVGHYAIRAILIDMGSLMTDLGSRARRRTTRIEDENIMVWMACSTAFIQTWMAAEVEFLATLLNLCKKKYISSEFPHLDKNLSTIRASCLQQLAELAELSDDLFVVPMAKLYQKLRKTALSFNYLLQVYFREVRAIYGPMWRTLDVAVLRRMEKGLATKIAQGDSGPLNTVILTAWMRKGQSAEWRRRCLDSRRRAAAKKAEPVYEENLQRLRLIYGGTGKQDL